MNSELNSNKDPNGYKRVGTIVRSTSNDEDNNPLKYLGVNNEWTLDGKYKKYVKE
jgi:hypothetical protein